MTKSILDNVTEMRAKLNEVWDKMSAEDFARIHSKFVGCVISVEEGFKKRFPNEWKRYEKDFYGEEE